MPDTTLRDILSDLTFREPDKSEKDRASVTFWFNPEEKARYDRLQELTRRRFAKKAREVLLALMAAAEQCA